MSLYSVFYEKLPHETDLLLPDCQGKLVTFLNPYYIETLKDRSDLYQNFDYICSDGMFPIILNHLWGKKKSERISFDMTSLAKLVFEKLLLSQDGVYFIGSSEDHIEKFIQVIRQKYAPLNIKGWHHGYIKKEFMSVALAILNSGAKVVVIGMGAPLQDEFAVFLKQQGFRGTIYTCGGFFHQTTQRINYYPDWIDRWNLRTFYRLVHEQYVWKRVLKYYPRFVISYSAFLSKLKLSD